MDTAVRKRLDVSRRQVEALLRGERSSHDQYGLT